MKYYLVSIALVSSTAYAHLVPLKDASLLLLTYNDYDLAFKMEDSCVKAGLSDKLCLTMLGNDDPKRAEAVRLCIAKEYVPLFPVEIKKLNEDKARPHVEVLESADIGKHFYSVDEVRADVSMNSYQNLLIKSGWEIKKLNEGPDAKLSKEEWAKIEDDAKEALNNPLLGGYSLSTICGEFSKYCVGTGSKTLLNPIWKAGDKTVKQIEVKPMGKDVPTLANQLKAPSFKAGYKEALELCIVSKMKSVK